MSEVPEQDPIHPAGSGTPDEGYAAVPQAEQPGLPEQPTESESATRHEDALQSAPQSTPEFEAVHADAFGARGEDQVATSQDEETGSPDRWAAPAAETTHGYGQPFEHYDGPRFLPPVPFAPYHRPARSPHLGHVVLFCLLLIFGWAGSMLFIFAAMHAHLFGVTTINQVKTSAPYLLGSEAILYLITLGACLLIFPIVWRKSFLDGLQWNGTAALRRYRVLLSTAFVCFLLAMLSQYLLPGPENAPIDKIFRAPGAAWIMFFFGITFAPFFEEMVFRGLLLPAFCTACDWIGEKYRHEDPPPLDEHGHPQWSFGAMVFGSVAASIPFALMHAPQTGYSLGPFTLLIVVSLVLCWARLSSRSLAASVLVHASYNFLLFTVMLIGTEGFRNMHKL